MRKIGYIAIVAAMVVYAIAAVFLDFYASERRCADALGWDEIRGAGRGGIERGRSRT